MPQLPRIACFHGGGSNGGIFEVQCARLQAELQNDFEFVYFDAPFDRAAGPGVLPAFEDYAPFKSWFKTDDKGAIIGDGSGYDELNKDGIERVWSLMRDVKGGKWVGAMGFSQGTRVASGLLLDQQRRIATGDQNNIINLTFGVLCMGGGAPMESEIGHAKKHDIELIRIPTLHLHGLKDVYLPKGKEQKATYFDQTATKLYEIDYHHAMPWNQPEVLQLATLIKQIYDDSKTV